MLERGGRVPAVKSYWIPGLGRPSAVGREGFRVCGDALLPQLQGAATVNRDRNSHYQSVFAENMMATFGAAMNPAVLFKLLAEFLAVRRIHTAICTM